jgi:organic hydroperoxide reductase OsmC/OhrA
MNAHHYEIAIRWTSDRGRGTAAYHSYERAFEIGGEGKPSLAASADPHFRGDSSRYNPEELLLASLSGCHLLSYLHVCSDAGVVVRRYEDHPRGTMTLTRDGGGAFSEVVLRPQVTVETGAMIDAAIGLHTLARQRCFIANSVNFPVHHEPRVTSPGG